MDALNGKQETLDDESNLEGEDFLCRLTDEEKECLQYLLATIDSLDQDEDENTNNDPGQSNLPMRDHEKSLKGSKIPMKS
ncbi:uncharacterized protein [Eleutherodactylus coqui]|uniref:uncharacterized protein isoform X3 n=1 Tax=Eleutherodactylus coqui TaxID=57060 RepID=UPI0034626810